MVQRLKKAIDDYTYDELCSILADIGEPRYRAGQVFSWLAKGAAIAEMSDLSGALRDKLAERFEIARPNILRRYESRLDETVKYLMGLRDGAAVETVAMRYKHGLSVCVSTQVGCRMGCAFCASTVSGLLRNLTPGEIAGQVTAVGRDLENRPSNIVLMGIGEPLDNYDNVIAFIRNISHPKGLNLSPRHISLSTCGLIDGIRRLAAENLPVTLSLSLHAPNDTIRAKLMPIAKRYSVDQTLAASMEYFNATGRRVSIEYSLVDGINDSTAAADELARKLKGKPFHVNLIQANKIDGGHFSGSSNETCRKFRDQLIKRGINTTIRRSLGGDISGSCGQLKTQSVVEIKTENMK